MYIQTNSSSLALSIYLDRAIDYTYLYDIIPELIYRERILKILSKRLVLQCTF